MMRVVTGFAAALAFALPVQQQPVFRSNVDVVTVDVAVTFAGKPVANLTVADFEILDNGVPQILRGTTAAGSAAAGAAAASASSVASAALPIDVTLIVDASSSVGGLLLEALRRALDAVTARLRPDDGVRLVMFNQRVTVGDMAQPQDIGSISARLGRTTGHTSLLDALTVALVTESRPNRREIAIVFTDGGDTTSIVGEATVLDVARRTNAAVFSVVLLSPFRTRPDHERLLVSLAALTGGRVTVLERNHDLAASFTKALDDFRSSYVLQYELQGVERRGWHDLQVSVRNHPEYIVRARKGYFGG